MEFYFGIWCDFQCIVYYGESFCFFIVKFKVLLMYVGIGNFVDIVIGNRMVVVEVMYVIVQVVVLCQIFIKCYVVFQVKELVVVVCQVVIVCSF